MFHMAGSLGRALTKRVDEDIERCKIITEYNVARACESPRFDQTFDTLLAKLD
jgi:hypothetical protein